MKTIKNVNQKKSKGALFWIASLLMIIFLAKMLSDVSDGGVRKILFSDFMKNVESSKVITAIIDGNVVKGEMKSAYDKEDKVEKYETAIPIEYPEFISILRKNEVNIKVKPLNKNVWATMIISALPFLLILIFWIVIMRQQAGGKAFSFGKSKARLFSGEKNKFTSAASASPRWDPLSLAKVLVHRA